MTIKIPESVIMRTQKEVYEIHKEVQEARRKVKEAEGSLERAKNVLEFNRENFVETCEFLDEVSPMDANDDWDWVQEIDPSFRKEANN